MKYLDLCSGSSSVFRNEMKKNVSRTLEPKHKIFLSTSNFLIRFFKDSFEMPKINQNSQRVKQFFLYLKTNGK
ncbi:hypothetical protein ACFP3I_03675 [Chryseobacterium arachidis]|uniref:hypothetical protein n=1 Tax=Chryseobacterium arachidis TaxID=1416778 RepID=UPI0036114156